MIDENDDNDDCQACSDLNMFMTDREAQDWEHHIARDIGRFEGFAMAVGWLGMADAIKTYHPGCVKCDYCDLPFRFSYDTTLVGHKVYCSSPCADRGDPRVDSRTRIC